MREGLYFIASLAAAVMLTSLAVLMEKSPVWGALLWVGSAVFAVSTLLILRDMIVHRTLRRRRGSSFSEAASKVYPHLPSADDSWWSRLFRRAAPTSARISIMQLFREAERQGLRFMGDGDDILPFVAALRQAGADGTLTFWGRVKRESDPLLKITPEHWHDFEIDWTAIFEIGPPSGQVKAFCKDEDSANYFVGTKKLDRRAWLDLHVDAVALNWLERYRAAVTRT